MATLSWILPIKNEAESLPQLVAEITTVLPRISQEIIAINDASTDATAEVLKGLQSSYPQLRIITFRNHRGKWSALSTGLRQAQGSIIIALDSDLQDDPAEVTKLLPKLDQGYAVASGWRRFRSDPPWKVYLSRLGNAFVALIGLGRFADLNSSMKVFQSHVQDAIPQQGSLLRFILIFAQRAGYQVIEVPIHHRPRVYGRSKFGVRKYVRILYDVLMIRLLFWGSARLTKQL